MVGKARAATNMSESELEAYGKALAAQVEPKEKRINWLEAHDKCPPTCTTKKQYKFWREMDSSHIGHSGFCTDCTPEWQHKCLINDCCDHPEVTFFMDDEGLVEGTHYGEHSKREVITYKRWMEMKAKL